MSWPRVAVAAVLALNAGCAPAYRPQPSPRIAIVEDPWTGTTLVRDGQEHSIGFLGSGVVDAVEGNPLAVNTAEDAFGLSVGGFVLSILGSAGAGAGLGIVLGNELSNNRNTDLRVAGLAIAAGGLAFMIPGVILSSAGRVEMFNAINIYNDGVDAQLRGPGFVVPPILPPAAYPPVAPLPPPDPPPAVPPPVDEPPPEDEPAPSPEPSPE